MTGSAARNTGRVPTDPTPPDPRPTDPRPTGGGFVGLTLRRPVSVLMALSAALAVAVIALFQMPLELIPDGILESRNLHISVGYSGASPREIEETILKPIEEALGSVPDIEEVWSYASENEGDVRVRFTSRADLDLAYVEVRDRMERLKSRFPEQAERYHLRRRSGGSNDIPIMWIGLNFEGDLREVSPLVDDIVRRKLEQIDGVASASVRGLAAEEVRVEIDSDAARAYGVDLYDLVQRLRRENVSDIGGGEVYDGRLKFTVRTRSRFRDLDEVRRYPVRPGLTLGEIADVRKAHALQQFAFRALGRSAMGLQVFKESTANTVAVCDRVARVVADELATDPRLSGIDFRIFWNQATWIRASLDQLRDTAIYGALFALLILYLFLRRVRMTLIITAAIPVSTLTALGALYFSGFTLNMLSLLGLTLAVGMLVDNSVVVVENIVRRRRQGEAAFEAALHGTREVGLAIFMSTLTTLVVFLPFVFLSTSGPPPGLILEIVMPVAFSLTASLAVSLGLIPLATVFAVRHRPAPISTDVGSGAGNPPRPLRPRPGPRGLTRMGLAVAGSYENVLALALRHRFKTMLVGGLFMLSAIPACERLNWRSGGMGHRPSYSVQLEFPRKFTLGEASRVVADYEKLFLGRKQELKIDFLFAWFHRRQGSVMVFLDNVPDWGPQDLARRVNEQLPDHPGVVRHVRYEGQDEAEDERSMFPIHIFGPDSRVLTELAAELKPRLEAVPGVREVTTEEERGYDEIHFRVDRTRAGKYRVDPRSVRGSVVYALQGARLLDFAENDREIPMVMRFSEEETEGLEAFEKFLVYSETGEQIPLEALSTYTFGKGYDRIVRQNRRTVYRILVRVQDPEQLWTTSLRVKGALRDFPLPQGYAWEPAGSLAALASERSAMVVALLLGSLFLYLVMGALFESFLLPLPILLVTIPSAVVGGTWALVFTGTSLDPTSILGFIILVGIVVNNGIVLVDYINRLRREGSLRWTPVAELAGHPLRPVRLAARPPEQALARLEKPGLDREDAIRFGTRHRFRPVLMTALTTIGGLLPMVFSAPTQEGFDYLPLSRIVVGGLVVATGVTLVLIPVTYTLLDDLGRWFVGAMARLARRRLRPSELAAKPVSPVSR